MIKPKPYKLKCTKCNYTKSITPKSDTLKPTDMINTCPKCGGTMQKVELSLVDKIITKLS